MESLKKKLPISLNQEIEHKCLKGSWLKILLIYCQTLFFLIYKPLIHLLSIIQHYNSNRDL